MIDLAASELVEVARTAARLFDVGSVTQCPLALEGDAMLTNQPARITPETVGRFASEVAGLRLDRAALEPIATLLDSLLAEVRALDKMELADIEPLHRFRLERWSS